MSKTVDELCDVFGQACNAEYDRWLSETTDTMNGVGVIKRMRRSGIRAVVRALRDEMEINGEHQSCHVLTKILGNAGEKAARAAPMGDESRIGHPALAADPLAKYGATLRAETAAEHDSTLPAAGPDPKQSGYTEYMTETLPMKIADTAPHDWFEYKPNLITCRACGIVRRADGKNKPCKGVVRVGPRAADPAPDVCVWEPQRSLPDWMLTACGTVCTERSNRNGKCMSCGKSIKFTEAK